jgi:hypothetical protein
MYFVLLDGFFVFSFFEGRLLVPYLVFLFLIFFEQNKFENSVQKSWVDLTTVTQDTGATIFERNFIFRIQYIKTVVATHSTREREKKTQYRLRK